MQKSTNNRPSRRPRPSTWTIWKTASRPHTLTASICPCLVSYAYCRATTNSTANDNNDDTASINQIFVLWIIFCCTIQLGTNLHNDYADYVNGADIVGIRKGHLRVTAQGWWTPTQTCQYTTCTLTVTFISGIILAIITNQMTNIVYWYWICTSIINAFAYTGGYFPLGYLTLGVWKPNWSIGYFGLGDVFVFLYFGLVATWMIPYLLFCIEQQDAQTQDSSKLSMSLPTSFIHSMPTTLFILGIQVGCLAMNILVVNNLRDRHTDLTANKMTTAVRFGRTFSIAQYMINNILTFGLCLVVSLDDEESRWKRWLPLLVLPWVQSETLAVGRKEGSDLNPHVGGAAKTQLFFCLLTCIRFALVSSSTSA